MPKKGVDLAILLGAPKRKGKMDDESDDYEGDESESESMESEFDEYADLALDPDTSPEDRRHALKMAIRACMTDYGEEQE